jgi:hypothetical protein
MSADKQKSLARRIQILRGAVGCYSHYVEQYVTIEALARIKPLSGGVYFHCEGGMSMDDPDIQRLLEDGHLGPIRQRTPSKKFIGKFLEFFRWKDWDGSLNKNGSSINGHAPRTYRPVTEAGIQFLKANDHKIPYYKRWGTKL